MAGSIKQCPCSKNAIECIAHCSKWPCDGPVRSPCFHHLTAGKRPNSEHSLAACRLPAWLRAAVFTVYFLQLQPCSLLPSSWGRQAIVLVEKHSSCAADELCALALTRHPHSYALAEKAASITLPSGECPGQAAVSPPLHQHQCALHISQMQPA